MKRPEKITIALEPGFHYNEAVENPSHPRALPPDAPLVDLVGFTNPVDPKVGIKFGGRGFNTIFRPQNPASPASLPIPVPGSDNVLELNLTFETLTFSGSLGNVPNRGFGSQPDISLNAVPYVQSVFDLTQNFNSPYPTKETAIHFEPGMWLAVPATNIPDVGITTYARMASIPHGITINAQGKSSGRLSGNQIQINSANINPFPIGGSQNPPSNPFFPSQTLTNQTEARIPQDLSAFNTSGTITQPLLDNPNSLLDFHRQGQNLDSFIAIEITTDNPGAQPTPPTAPLPPPVPTSPGVGGGTGEIGFLLGDNNTPPSRPNAHAFKMTATFWIETILETISVPAYNPGEPALLIEGSTRNGNIPPVIFSVTPPRVISAPVTIQVSYTQIQYTQTVFLNFAPLTWPHVSVATLVPLEPVEVPTSVWG